RKTIVALAGVAAFGTAQAARWVPVAAAVRDDLHLTYFIDADSIVKEPEGTVRAWFKSTLSRPEMMGTGEIYDNTVFNNRYWCSTRQLSSGPITWYLRKASIASDTKFQERGEVIPDSIGATLLTVACANGKKK